MGVVYATYESFFQGIYNLAQSANANEYPIKVL